MSSKVQAADDIENQDVSAKTEQGDTNKNWCYVTIGLVLVIGAALVIANFAIPGGLQNPFEKNEPPGLEEATAWYNPEKNGLTLTVINALETGTSYNEYLDEYILKWQLSDALILNTVRVDHDPECDPVLGRVKVCNSDYGATDWRGIAISLLQGGYIRYSIAKLNDYFLIPEGEIQQRYTM
jgi:hypothetical protein